MPDDTDKRPFIPRSPDSRGLSHHNGEMWSSTNDDNTSERSLVLKTPESQDQLLARAVPGLLDYSPGGARKSPTPHVKVESPTDGAMELNGEIWMTTNEHAASGASRVPFTKREKEFLCSLIQKHVYAKIGEAQCDLSNLGVYNPKNTMTSFCRIPNAAWKAIETEFNSKENVRTRSIKQLRKCWENLKHRGNIDPAALYSGKKLHARTSMSGAFTLTTGEGEEAQMNALGPTPSMEHGSFVETTFEEEAPRCTDPGPSLVVQPRDVFSPNISPQSRNVVPNTTLSKSHNIGENIFHLNDDRSRNIEGMTSSPLTASQLIASLSRSSTTTSQFVASSTRPTSHTPRISNVRTVRSLKPVLAPPRRRLPAENRHRPIGSRVFSNFSTVTKTHSQRIHEMKVKLMSARIKEHEANIQKVNMQMQQAQAHHDVTMRLLRTKAAWYDVHLRKLEKQLRVGDVALVGEDDEEYLGDSFNEMEMQYDEE